MQTKEERVASYYRKKSNKSKAKKKNIPVELRKKYIRTIKHKGEYHG
jgi:hypothetical protein